MRSVSHCAKKTQHHHKRRTLSGYPCFIFLMKPSHYLHQCWLSINGVMQYSHEGNFTNNFKDSSHEIHLKISFTPTGTETIHLRPPSAFGRLSRCLMGSINNISSSGCRKCKHVFGHPGWVQKLSRWKQNYRNRWYWYKGSCANKTKQLAV